MMWLTMQPDRSMTGFGGSRPRRYRQIAESLREMILSGEINPGERLPTERDLATQFGVSRSCIREALLALEILNLVHIRVGSGVYVANGAQALQPHFSREVEPPSVAHILNARLLFEPEICAAAAMLAEADDIAALRSLHEVRLAGSPDPDIAARHYRDFHLGIARLVRNPLAHSLMLGIWQAARARPEWETLRALLQSPERQRIWQEEHDVILTALEKRHRGDSRSAMRRHVENVIALVDEAGML
jgi:DNA-binding FadR family transcriptional regulator